MFEWKSQTCRGENNYRMQIETDDPEKYEVLQYLVRCVMDYKRDARPHAHLRFLRTTDDGKHKYYGCSRCGEMWVLKKDTDPRKAVLYCEHCGARLDEEVRHGGTD